MKTYELIFKFPLVENIEERHSVALPNRDAIMPILLALKAYDGKYSEAILMDGEEKLAVFAFNPAPFEGDPCWSIDWINS